VNARGYSGLIFPSTITCFHFSYSERVKAAATALERDGYLIAEDVKRIVDNAAKVTW